MLEIVRKSSAVRASLGSTIRTPASRSSSNLITPSSVLRAGPFLRLASPTEPLGRSSKSRHTSPRLLLQRSPLYVLDPNEEELVHDRREFVSAAERATRSLLAADDRTSGLAEAVLLDRQVLALGTAPRVPDLRHPHRPFFSTTDVAGPIWSRYWGWSPNSNLASSVSARRLVSREPRPRSLQGTQADGACRAGSSNAQGWCWSERHRERAGDQPDECASGTKRQLSGAIRPCWLDTQSVTTPATTAILENIALSRAAWPRC